MNVTGNMEKIAAEKFSGYSWIYDDWKSADRALAKADVPAIVCIMPAGGTLTFRRGRAWDSPNCLLCFLDKVKRDADGQDNEAVFERMKAEAARFVGEMNRSGLFEQIDGDVPYDTIIEGTANVLTGVALSLTIKEAKGICL